MAGGDTYKVLDALARLAEELGPASPNLSASRQPRGKPRAKRAKPPTGRPTQRPPRKKKIDWADLLGLCGSLLGGGALALRLFDHLCSGPSAALPAGDAIDTAPVPQPDGRIVSEPR